jgi:hypothetical protein
MLKIKQVGLMGKVRSVPKGERVGERRREGVKERER